MLTKSGGFALLSGIAIVATGRVFGIPELFIIGTAIALLVLAAWCWALFSPARLTYLRAQEHEQLFAGTDSRVTLVAKNTGRLQSPPVRMTDESSRGASPTFRIPPLRSGTSFDAHYPIDTTQRGILTLGPILQETRDSFSFTRKQRTVKIMNNLVIYPSLHPVSLPDIAANEGTSTFQRTPHRTEYVASLRTYTAGDDLRRVHWKASARSEELLIREYETPVAAHHTTVLFDVARRNYGDEFESAVSAAASVVAAAFLQQHRVRFLTTDGFDSQELTSDPGHTISYALATVHPSDTRLDVATPTQRGLLVLISGPNADLTAFAPFATAFPTVLTVGSATSPFGLSIPLSSDEPFAAVWESLIKSRSA
jgi:uncharacterized protein (DUF58 family)